MMKALIMCLAIAACCVCCGTPVNQITFDTVFSGAYARFNNSTPIQFGTTPAFAVGLDSALLKILDPLGNLMLCVADRGTNGALGIGVAPEALLHVWSGESGFTGMRDTSVQNGALIEGAGNATMEIQTPSTNTGAIWFGDAASENAGRVQYNHATDVMSIYAGGAEKFAVNSDGELKIAGDWYGIADLIGGSGGGGFWTRASSVVSLAYPDDAVTIQGGTLTLGPGPYELGAQLNVQGGTDGAGGIDIHGNSTSTSGSLRVWSGGTYANQKWTMTAPSKNKLSFDNGWGGFVEFTGNGGLNGPQWSFLPGEIKYGAESGAGNTVTITTDQSFVVPSAPIETGSAGVARGNVTVRSGADDDEPGVLHMFNAAGHGFYSYMSPSGDGLMISSELPDGNTQGMYTAASKFITESGATDAVDLDSDEVSGVLPNSHVAHDLTIDGGSIVNSSGSFTRLGVNGGVSANGLYIPSDQGITLLSGSVDTGFGIIALLYAYDSDNEMRATLSAIGSIVDFNGSTGISFSSDTGDVPVEVTAGSLSLQAGSIAADDTSPSVKTGNVFTIPSTWTSGHDITAFDDGRVGQTIRVRGGDADCVIVDGTGLELAGNWTAAPGNTLILTMYSTGVWTEDSRSSNN